MIHNFLSIYLKFFFLLTPFFVLSSFLAMTIDQSARERRITAVKVTVSVIIISLLLLSIGREIFTLFGITLDSFRIGTGVLLFISAKRLIDGYENIRTEQQGDFSVVPLAIPITVGPATTGALLVMGYDLKEMPERVAGIAALIAAIITVGAMLYLGTLIERVLKRQGLNILSKITGLILAALSAQMIMIGIQGFFPGRG